VRVECAPRFFSGYTYSYLFGRPGDDNLIVLIPDEPKKFLLEPVRTVA
jgi:hypothetical protein